MRLDESVTTWIEHLKEGSEDAARHLWQRYYTGLVKMALHQLRGRQRRAADEEDVVLSAFDSFCRAVQAGRFPRLNDRDDLWRVLVCLTERKAIDLLRREQRLRKGGGNVQGESALAENLPGGLDALAARAPTPDFVAQMTEACQRLLNLLGDDVLRSVALQKLEGFTNEEIAARLGCALRSVERKLRLIRELWMKEGPNE